MVAEYKLNIYKDAKPIIFKYIEVHYPLMDTVVTKYDAYKLNIMLSDGLAAVLNQRNDVYNTFSGDVLFFSPTEIHHGRILRQGMHKYIEILIPTEYFPTDKICTQLFSDNTRERSNLLSPQLKERAKILSLAENICEKIKPSSPADNITLFSYLIELLKICSILSEKRENNRNIPAILENAITFIRENYSENIQIPDISKATNCSPSYLSRIFRKHMGKSPYCYLTEYRLFVAEKLLRSGNSITDAALMSGFCDSSVFIKCFKKAFGTTPLKYKKRII